MIKREFLLDSFDGKFLYLIEKWQHIGFDYVSIKNSDTSIAMFEDDKCNVISFEKNLTFKCNFSISRCVLALITWTLDYFISLHNNNKF